MHKLTNYRKAGIGFAVAAAIILSIGIFQGIARADISNPHPTPPAGSVTNTIIAPNTILDSNVSPSAAIQLTKLQAGIATGSILISNGSGVATTSAVIYATSTNTLTVTASTTITATTTISATAAAPLILNGVTYTAPSSQGTNGQSLKNNGSGGLSWGSAGSFIATSSQVSNSSSNGTYTFSTITLPANTLGTGNIVDYWVPITGYSDNGVSSSITFNYGGTGFSCTMSTGTYSGQGYMDFKIVESQNTSTQYLYAYMELYPSNTTVQHCINNGTASVDSTANQTILIQQTWGNGTTNFSTGTGILSVTR